MFKFPIPRKYRNKLTYTLITVNSEYYELSDMLLSGLTGTEIPLVVHFLGATEQFLYANKYLNPLRDLDPCMAISKSFIEKGCRTLMLGNDIPDPLHGHRDERSSHTVHGDDWRGSSSLSTSTRHSVAQVYVHCGDSLL